MSERQSLCGICRGVTKWIQHRSEEHECVNCHTVKTFDKLNIAALDAEFAAKIPVVQKGWGVDLEKPHYKADELVTELLRKLGCDKTADAFEHLPKWYS